MSNPLLIIPIIMPVSGAFIALLSAKNNRIQRIIMVVSGLLAWLSALALLYIVNEQGTQIYYLGGWQPPYGIVLVGDLLSSLMLVMSTTIMLAGFIYAYGAKDVCLTYPTFLPLFMLMAVGLNIVFITGDLFTFFVGMEIMVLTAVSMVAISDDRYGLEAAMKYIFISSIGTVLILLGIGATYIEYGTLNMAHIFQQMISTETSALAQAARTMLLLAFMLKSAVFPFHFWQPDFHTTAPTPVSAMLSSIIVKVGIYGIIRLSTLVAFINPDSLLQQIIILLGLVGIIYGGLSALRTYNGKRMLAYSTISQVGFILLGIGWGTPLAVAAAVVYSFNHAFIKSALLMLMGVVASRTDPKTADFAQLKGVGSEMPVMISVLWMLGAMSISGLPPLNGFISKLSLVQSGAEIESWLPLIVAVFAGLLTLIYMMRAWQNIFQRQREENSSQVKAYGDSYLAPALLIAGCILLGVFASPLLNIAERATDDLFDPSQYIEAVGLPIIIQNQQPDNIDDPSEQGISLEVNEEGP